MDKNNSLKKHIEGKIFKGYMIISNLKEEEFQYIDDYCKYNFSNNRRQMILSLIKYYDGDTAVRLLDDKLLLIYEELNNRIDELEKKLTDNENPVKKERPKWKGFKQSD